MDLLVKTDSAKLYQVEKKYFNVFIFTSKGIKTA